MKFSDGLASQMQKAFYRTYHIKPTDKRVTIHTVGLQEDALFLVATIKKYKMKVEIVLGRFVANEGLRALAEALTRKLK